MTITKKKKVLEPNYFGLKNEMKKVIILQHGGGELANQLWTFASIYAYCLEKGFNCQNPSFFEYGQYFNIPMDNKMIYNILFSKFRNHHQRRNHLKNKYWRFVYKIYAKIMVYLFKQKVVSSINKYNKKTYLSPTKENFYLNKLEKNLKPIYLIGWLFRNPEGLKKYRKEIIEYFRPKEIYTKPAETKINELRSGYKNIVGVHIRQSDYKNYKGGNYYIPQERVRKILDEYLLKIGKNLDDTVFVVVSDGKIQENIFNELNIYINKGNPVEDLYILSLCDIIIGSNSTFGHFASYYGNISHIIFNNNHMDWNYYKDKNSFFENKYSVMYKTSSR